MVASTELVLLKLAQPTQHVQAVFALQRVMIYSRILTLYRGMICASPFLPFLGLTVGIVVILQRVYTIRPDIPEHCTSVWIAQMCNGEDVQVPQRAPDGNNVGSAPRAWHHLEN